MAGEQPQHAGRPLRRLTRAWQVQTAWWESPDAAARRDYYVAESASAGLVFVYRESCLGSGPEGEGAAPPPRTHRWFLQGYYA
jgi:hypothetical protein